MTDERNPLAGRTGRLVVLLRSLTGADLRQFIVYWETRTIEHDRRGDGYGAWWCTKHSSIGRSEQRRRSRSVS